ncbi:MAG: gliding motility-associated C-terminal domain-containing protein [Bacteroidetes bacterium]|nr:gliding motility-associated C-terminal domain-containing protein [Bacteroidota bacterium]HET6245740.1 gliding motility-associated C-terminal domain-containing protein [Bacteroidia bacterium]
MKSIFLILLSIILFTGYSIAQTYTMNNGSNGTVTTCSGTFVDNGGAGSNYSANQNSTITFCPSTPGDVISINFSSFNTESASGFCYDYLNLWHASSAGGAGTSDNQLCGNLGSFIVNSLSPDGCITFQFFSDGSVQRAGWVGTVSCITGCTNPTAALTDYSTLDICPTTALNPGSLTVAFDASPSTSSPGTTISSYIWQWGDGTTNTTTTSTTTHTYASAGVYSVKLFVKDSNTSIFPTGCMSSNSATKLIRIIPPPSFTGTTTSPLSISCGQSVNLDGIVKSQTATQATPTIITGVVPLPDGSGVSYTSGIDYTGFFPVGSTVSPSCYPTLTFNIEHSYTGDLTIDLIAPSGQTVRVFNQTGSGNKFGTCSKEQDDQVPGCGALYTVVNTGGVAWPPAGLNASTTNISASCAIYSGPCEVGNYTRPITFNSATNFAALNGAALNGIWTLKITDNLFQDDGTLFGWALSFPNSCYNSLESITPDIASANWSHSGLGPIVPAQSSTSTTVTDPGPSMCPTAGTCIGNQLANTISVGPFTTSGSFDYTFSATDEFGCQYQRVVTVNVSGVATPSAISNSPICEGATLNLSTPTVTDAIYNWTGPNGFASSDQNPVIPNVTSAFAGIYELILDVNGCLSSAGSVNVTINPMPPASAASYNNPICEGQTLNLFTPVSSGVTYNWTGPNSFLSTNQNPTIPNANSIHEGVYSVTYAIGSCTGTANTVNITITPNDNPSFEYSTDVYCQSGTTSPIITGTVGGSFSAIPMGLSLDASTGEIDLSLSSSNTYSITYTTNGICSEDSTVTIVITSAPEADFNYSGPFCLNEINPMPILAPGASSGNFSSSSGLSIDVNTGEIDLTTSSAGTYIVTNTVSLTGCPVVSFGVTVVLNSIPTLTITNPIAVCSPETVDITAALVTDGSTPGGNYTYWNDLGATDALISPEAISTSGTYYIQTNVSGCTNIETVDVTINSIPVLNINDPAPLCEPLTVDLTDASVTSGSTMGGTLTYWIDAGATIPLGSPDEIAVNGVFYIQTSVSGCTNIEPVIVTINAKPVLDITNPAAVCSPSTVDLTESSVTAGSTGAGTLTYWTDSGATNASTSPNAVTSSGTYYIQATENGCIDLQPVIVTINPNPVLTITDPLSVCSPNSIDLTDPSITVGSTSAGTLTYWEDAGTTVSLTAPNAVNLSGTYYIQITESGCSVTGSVLVSINTNPVLAITNPPVVCSPSTVNLTDPSITFGSTGGGTLTYWTDAGATISLTSPNSVPSSGIYYIQNTNTTTGCFTIEPVVVSVQAIPAAPTLGSNTPCEGGNLILSSGLTNGTVNWTSPNGSSIPGNNPQINNVSTFHAGNYSATLTENGCTSLPSVLSVNVFSKPLDPIIQSINAQCAGTNIQLNASDVVNGSFNWTGPNGFTSNVQNPLINNLNSQNIGTYNLTVTVNGCVSNSAQTTATIDYADALFTATPLTGITPHNVNFSNQSSFANNYTWHFGTGISSNQKDTSYNYTEGGSYEVILIAYSSLANCPDTFSVTIFVESDSNLEAPNVFTPNADGKNDVFKVKSRGLKSYSCSIYNRWGKLVFVSDDYNVGWDGKVSGNEAADGTYFVMIKAEGLDGKPYEHTGTVTLIR